MQLLNNEHKYWPGWESEIENKCEEFVSVEQEEWRLADIVGAPHQSMAAIHLARNGCEIDYYAWGNNEVDDNARDLTQAMNYVLYSKSGIISAIMFFFFLYLARFRKYDYIYVQGAQQTPFALLAFCGIKREKLIYHTQDYLEPGRYRFYEFFERLFARKAGSVIWNEPNRARFMQSNYKLKVPTKVIRTFLPSWWPVPSCDFGYREHVLKKIEGFDLSKSDEYRLVIAGGGYSTVRCSHMVVDALVTLPENYILVFSGGGDFELARSHIQEAGIKHRVVFMGRLSYADLLKLYFAGDMGLLLYLDDGVGNFYQGPGRLTEYLRCGLPVITNCYPGLELLTIKFSLGECCDIESLSSIKAAILRIGEKSRVVLDEESTRLQKLSKEKLCYEKQANVLKEIFENE